MHAIFLPGDRMKSELKKSEQSESKKVQFLEVADLADTKMKEAAKPIYLTRYE